MKIIGIVFGVFAVVFAIGVYSTLDNNNAGYCPAHGKYSSEHNYGMKTGDCDLKMGRKHRGWKSGHDHGSCVHNESGLTDRDCLLVDKMWGKWNHGSWRKFMARQGRHGDSNECKEHGSAHKSQFKHKGHNCGAGCKHHEMKMDAICKHCGLPKADCSCIGEKIEKCKHGPEDAAACPKHSGKMKPQK